MYFTLNYLYIYICILCIVEPDCTSTSLRLELYVVFVIVIVIVSSRRGVIFRCLNLNYVGLYTVNTWGTTWVE
jgi:hypothetical protein